MIHKIYNQILNLDTFSPNLITNQAFTDLYTFAISSEDYYCDDLPNDKINTLQWICSTAESCMEKHYSKKIIEAKNTEEEFKNFIYYKNYNDLVELEYLQMQYVNEETNNVLFIWWWSLPMSAILLAKKYNIQVDIVDCDIEAVESWIKLINKLWLSEKIQYFLWNANNFKTDKNYDSVFLAALVFQSNDINNILDNVQLLHFNSLFIRSVEGVRKLLYKPVDKKLINNYFSPIFEVHPKNELINSILIYKKK